MAFVKKTGVLLLAGAIHSSASLAVTHQVSGIFSPEKTVKRYELIAKDKGGIADFYTWAEEGNGEFLRFRGQLTPVKKGRVSVGVAGTWLHANGNAGFDFGPLLRLSGKRGEISYKFEIRHFLGSGSEDFYGFVSGKRLFGDLRGVHNFDDDKGFLRPGIEYKIPTRSEESRNQFSIGIEGRFTTPNLERDYLGVRVKYQRKGKRRN